MRTCKRLQARQDKHGAQSNFESLHQLPRKNTFTNISLQMHGYFAYLLLLDPDTSMRKRKLSSIHSKRPTLKTTLMDHATRARGTKAPMWWPQRPDSDFSYATLKSKVITLDFHQRIKEISVCPGVSQSCSNFFRLTLM